MVPCSRRPPHIHLKLRRHLIVVSLKKGGEKKRDPGHFPCVLADAMVLTDAMGTTNALGTTIIKIVHVRIYT